MHLKAEGLMKKFNKVVVFSDISFDVYGEIIAVVGPNGSGKSTLLSIIAGLRYPSKGRLFLNDIEPYKEREKALEMMFFSFEKPRFNINIRVRDVVNTAKNLCLDRDRFLSSVDKLGLSELGFKKLYELSSGQSQLLSLVLALFCDARSIAILDEPLAHLDISYQGVFLDSIYSRKNVIFTTHVLEEAEVVADKILILANGKIKWIGDVEKMYLDNMYELVVSRKNMEKIKSLIQNDENEIVANFGTYVLVKGITEEDLQAFFKEKIIIGYRRAGLRSRIYGKT